MTQQAATPDITGIITDPLGYLVPNASVTLHPFPAGPDRATTANGAGRYTLALRSGEQFTLFVTAPGFAPFESKPMQSVGQTLDIHLKIEDQTQQVNVSDTDGMNTDPNNNGDAIVLKGKAINDLPLDSAELTQQLQGLAGSASPDFFIDGFSGGTLPPRDTIREIRINQNPYSALNDTNPGNGRIEVFTKPGSNKFHGDFFSYFNGSDLNARNPFVVQQPAYHSLFGYGSINGPINKSASFFINANHLTTTANAIVNAQVLDSATHLPVNFTQAVSAPHTYGSFSSRVDFAVGKKSTVIVRYSLDQSDQTNAGVGQFSLIGQGYQSANINQTLQVSNAQIVSAKIVNDTRFQYIRSRSQQTPTSLAPTLVVQGAFTDGGANQGASRDNQDRYEFQNYVSQTFRKHFFTYGTRLRDTRDANYSRAGYNGQFVFPTLAAYQLTQQGLPGGGATQFTITRGTPSIAVQVTDAALFFQDDWKLKPSFTLSSGLRFETQNGMADHADWAPRLGFAWGLGAVKGKPTRYMVRGGSGIFYKRFATSSLLQTDRQNGIAQQTYILANPPSFPNFPSDASLAASPSAVYRISPNFTSPYFIASSLSVERQVGTHGSVTLTYLNNRGVHTQLTRNINAPLPGTYNPLIPSSGVRPLGNTQNIFEYASAGVYRGNRLSANLFLRFKNKYSLYGYYQLRFDSSDSGGGSPSNPYNIRADYGRSSQDTRHNLSIGGNARLPYQFHMYFYLNAASGSPFNITVGQDLNGDSIFNDRPAFATDLSRASVAVTRYGTFDTAPMAGQTIIPINYVQGPAAYNLNLNFGRSFNFGPVVKPPPAPPAAKAAADAAPAGPAKVAEKPHIARLLSLEVSVDVQNVTNHPNYGNPVGTLNSPLFGRSNSLASNYNGGGNRVVEANIELHF